MSIADIVEHYGVQNQFGIHMEECAELVQAISKLNRAWGDKDKINEARDMVVEEIADVLICVTQLQYILNITTDELDTIIEAKVERQIRRIENENKAEV